MRALVLQGHERSLHARDGQVVVFLRGEEVHRMDASALEEVLLLGDVEMSAACRRLLLQKEVPVLFLSPAGAFRGALLGPGSRYGERRLAQYRAVADPGRRLALARAIVAGKLKNQVVPVRRAHRLAPQEELVEAAVAIGAAAEQARRARDLDELRGIEGYGARVYFRAMGRMLRNPAFSFQERSRRPPRDPFNAALSFLYTLLCHRTLHAAWRAGADPQLGLLHEAGRGKPALALDLAEEWRPIVDGVVLRVFNQSMVRPDDFVSLEALDPSLAPSGGEEGEEGEEEPPPREGGVWLGSVGRSIVLHAWDERLRERSRSAHLEGSWSLKEILDQQARHLVACFLDPSIEYEPFAWR